MAAEWRVTRRLGLPALLLGLAAPGAVLAAAYADVLDVPAVASPLARQRPVFGLAVAGSRVVAVGQRGHILLSDDAGEHWRQAAVPLSSDLLAVVFVDAARGWAAGHDGALLATLDGGETWHRQLDGRLAAAAMASHYAGAAPALRSEALRFAERGADKPFLDLAFENASTGFAVGAFNLIFRTADGGRTWQPWFDRTDNPDRLHLYGARRVGGDIYVVGEQGLVLKLDRQHERFVALPTPYRGTFFGVIGSGASVLVYGMRGNVYRSGDGGRHWQKIETGLTASLTAAADLPDGRLVLFSQAGDALISSDGGVSFRRAAVDRATPTTAVVVIGGSRLVAAGPRGLAVASLE